MGNPYSIYRCSYHNFSDNTIYQLIGKRILCNIPIQEKIFLVWNEYAYIKMELYHFLLS